MELLIKGIERHFVERLHALSRRDINPRVNRLLLAVDILPSRIRRYCLPGGVFHRIVSIYFIAVEMERRSFVSSFNLDSTELFYSLFFICSIFFDEQWYLFFKNQVVFPRGRANCYTGGAVGEAFKVFKVKIALARS